MKTRLTLLAILSLFFAGTYSSLAQEDTKKQQEKYDMEKKQYADSRNVVMKKSQTAELKPEDIAKTQTENLIQLLNLDENQALRVHELCLAVETKIAQISANLDTEKRTEMLNELENVKSEKFKEAFTADQYKMYQNSLNKE